MKVNIYLKGGGKVVLPGIEEINVKHNGLDPTALDMTFADTHTKGHERMLWGRLDEVAFVTTEDHS